MAKAKPTICGVIGLGYVGLPLAMVFAEAGVPICFVTMPTLGTTAPATRATMPSGTLT